MGPSARLGNLEKRYVCCPCLDSNPRSPSLGHRHCTNSAVLAASYVSAYLGYGAAVLKVVSDPKCRYLCLQINYYVLVTSHKLNSKKIKKWT